MAIKLTPKQLAKYTEISSHVSSAQADLEAAIEVFNEKLDKAFSAVEEAAQAYNEATDNVRQFLGELVAGWRLEWEDKSERWQEGEKGEAATVFIDEWEQLADGMEPIEIERPDPLDMPEFHDFDTLPADEPA